MNIFSHQKRIGELLVDKGLLSAEDIEVGLDQQKRTSEKLGKVLIELGLISEENMYRTLSEQVGLQYLSAADYPETPIVDIDFSVKFMRQYKFLPLEVKDNQILVMAMADPLDFDTIEQIKLSTNHKIRIYVSKESDILTAIEKYFGGDASSMEKIIGDMDDEELQLVGSSDDEDIDQLRDMASEAPIIKL
ncbi:MAG: hypothetical protein ACMUIP_18365, partial [bacterium]